MSTTIIWTIVILSALGLVLALVLFFIAKKFKVEEAEKVLDVDALVEKALSGVECVTL